jgi:uncharacterized membrane protein YkoI
LTSEALGGGEVVSAELKQTKAGQIIYKIKAITNGNRNEVVLDAITGKVLSID